MTEQLQLILAPGIRFQRRDIELPENLTRTQCIDLGRFLCSCEESTQFWWARWKEYVQRKFGMEFLATVIGLFQRETESGQLRFDVAGLKQADILNKIVDCWTTSLLPEHHFVLAKANWEKDRPGQEHWNKMSPEEKDEWHTQWNKQWAETAEKEKLSPRELQESIRLGTVTRIELDPDKDRGIGFASIQGWYMHWKLWRKQIEDIWRDWSDDQIKEALAYITPVEIFGQALRGLRLEKQHERENVS